MTNDDETSAEKPNSLKSAVAKTLSEGRNPNDDEELPEDGEEGALEEPYEGATPEEVEKAESNAVPEWVELPAGFKMPRMGRQVLFVRFLARWTDAPEAGDRQCVLWNLTDVDERFALKRTRGDHVRTIDEMTKQMIRAIDGNRVDWGTTGDAVVRKFWAEIGGKCRQQLKNIYAKQHTMTVEDQTAFFGSCVAVRTSAG